MALPLVLPLPFQVRSDRALICLYQGFLTSGKFPTSGKFEDLTREILKLQIDNIDYTHFKDIAVVTHFHYILGADTRFYCG